MGINWKKYGHSIGDSEEKLRNINDILSELEEIQQHFSTHSMNESALFLQGKAEMLTEVIQYLKRI